MYCVTVVLVYIVQRISCVCTVNLLLNSQQYESHGNLSYS